MLHRTTVETPTSMLAAVPQSCNVAMTLQSAAGSSCTVDTAAAAAAAAARFPFAIQHLLTIDPAHDHRHHYHRRHNDVTEHVRHHLHHQQQQQQSATDDVITRSPPPAWSHVTYRRHADAMMADDVIQSRGLHVAAGVPACSPSSSLLPTPITSDSVSGKPPHAPSTCFACPAVCPALET